MSGWKGKVVHEMVELANYQPLNISAFGLVGQLRGTGDTMIGVAPRFLASAT